MPSSKSKTKTKIGKISSGKSRSDSKSNNSVEIVVDLVKSEESEESSEDPFFIDFNSDVSESDENSEASEFENIQKNKVVVESDFKVKVSNKESKSPASKSVKHVEHVKPVKHVEHVKSVKHLKHIKPDKPVKSIKSQKDKIDNSNESKSDTSTKKPLTNQRKIIYLDDDPAQPVTAAGVIFYRFEGKDMQLLLICSQGKLEDIGGKIDKIDKTIQEAAAREVEEETNSVITRDSIIDRLNSAKQIYIKNSKYLIYIVKADANERALIKEQFGEFEIHDNIERTIDWVPKNRVFGDYLRRKKLNYRMMSKFLKDQLTQVEKNKKFTKSLFT